MSYEKFFEAQSFNSCLNKKISINKQGEIKNCPALTSSYGNIKNSNLMEVVSGDNDFKKFWNISKNQVNICQNCEFRFICTDCRAFIDSPDDIYSKPLKCGYDPSTGDWEEWSENPLKKSAMKEYKFINKKNNS